MALPTIRLSLAGILPVLCISTAFAQALPPAEHWSASNVAGSADGPGASSQQAFALRILAPDDMRDFLQRHLELKRYQVLTDLSDAEIQSLLLTARQDASDLLATLGYFSPEIQIGLQRPEPADSATPDSGKVVQIEVLPGAQTRVALVSLSLEGGIAQDAGALEQRQSIRDLWALDTGELFSQGAWDLAKAQALKRLLARRYPTARVLSSRAEVHPEAASVDLALTLDSGPAYKFGNLEVQGNQRYSAELAKRFARLPTGADYESAQLVEAQRRLTDSGYYDSAYLRMDLDSDPQAATVRAQLKEASMQKAVFGVGASTDGGTRVSAEHSYNQVPGMDWRAVNKLSLSRDTKSFASDWTSQPGESPWRWAASALFEQDRVGEIELYTQRYRLGRFTTEASADHSYYLQWESTEAVLREINQSTTNQAFSANYAFALRHFDSSLFPTRGWGLGAELSAGTVLGSRQEPYTRALVHARLYQPLGQSLQNLFARQHAGRMMYRAQAGGVFVDNATNVPFNQLFLTGGDSTVRGYRHQEIGVSRDGILTAESGRYVMSGSIEWQRPVVRNGQMTDWETAVFLDAGAVSNQIDKFSFKTGVGVGARWNSPIGPLQIDLAYGLATEALRLHLNVGFVF